MYLTQLRLDPRHPAARRDLADPYDMHRTLVRAFVRDDKQAPPRFLWRLEPGRDWHQPVVLVQSALAPDWSFLSSAPGYLQPAGDPPSKTFEPQDLIQTGARCRFRLTANPTVTREGKRYGLVGENAQLAWLHRQGERLGFSVELGLVSGSLTVHGRKSGGRVSLLQVVFDGVLQVRDGAALSQAVTAGIGHGKAFGCGLLSLARSA